MMDHVDTATQLEYVTHGANMANVQRVKVVHLQLVIHQTIEQPHHAEDHHVIHNAANPIDHEIHHVTNNEVVHKEATTPTDQTGLADPIVHKHHNVPDIATDPTGQEDHYHVHEALRNDLPPTDPIDPIAAINHIVPIAVATKIRHPNNPNEENHHQEKKTNQYVTITYVTNVKTTLVTNTIHLAAHSTRITNALWAADVYFYIQKAMQQQLENQARTAKATPNPRVRQSQNPNEDTLHLRC
jgi:hypothetical protein